MAISKILEKAFPYVVGASIGESIITGIIIFKRRKESKALKDITEKGNVITGVKLSRFGLTRTYIFECAEAVKKEEEKNA